MTFSTFLIILLAAYLFYYAIVIILDRKPARKSLASQNSEVDFVFTPVQQPEKISIDESLIKYMPLAEPDIEEIDSSDQEEEDEESLQSMMRMETWSDEEPEEISGEELSQML